MIGIDHDNHLGLHRASNPKSLTAVKTRYKYKIRMSSRIQIWRAAQKQSAGPDRQHYLLMSESPPKRDPNRADIGRKAPTEGGENPRELVLPKTMASVSV